MCILHRNSACLKFVLGLSGMGRAVVQWWPGSLLIIVLISEAVGEAALRRPQWGLDCGRRRVQTVLVQKYIFITFVVIRLLLVG